VPKALTGSKEVNYETFNNYSGFGNCGNLVYRMGNQANGSPSCNAGKVELAVKTPTRKVFVTAERNGKLTTVNVYLLGWII
jgi:hypothetical protein